MVAQQSAIAPEASGTVDARVLGDIDESREQHCREPVTERATGKASHRPAKHAQRLHALLVVGERQALQSCSSDERLGPAALGADAVL